MEDDPGSGSRLRRLTRLNLSGAQQQIVDEYCASINDLDVVELLVLAHAARHTGSVDVLKDACERLRVALGDNAEVMKLRMQLACLASDRDLMRAVVQTATPANVPGPGPVQEDFLYRLVRAHAWDDLDRLLAHYGDAEEPGYAVLLARSMLRLRRRSFQRAFLDAEAAVERVPARFKNAALLVQARIADHARDHRQSGMILKDIMGGAVYDWASRVALYKASWASLRAYRAPLALRLLYRSEEKGAAGTGVLRLRGWIHVARGEYDEAYDAYQALLEGDPYDQDAVNGMCDVLSEISTQEEVLAFIDEKLQKLDTPELLARRVEALRAQGQHAQADHESSELTRRFPESHGPGRIRNVTPSQQSSWNETVADATFEGVAPPSKPPESFRPQWTDGELSKSARFASAFVVHWRVVSALLLREIRTRFGRLKLGYIWAFLEPLLHGGVMYLLWSFRGAASYEGHPLAVFLVLGLVPFFLFSETYGRLSRAVSSNQGLLAHRQVTPFDVMLSRAILELLTRIAVLFVYVVALVLVGFDLTLYKPLWLLATILLLSMAGTALGMTVQAYSPILLSLPNLMTMVIRILYLSSGVIFPLSLLPPSAQKVALLNPMAHLVQMGRNAFLPEPPLHGVTLVYPAIVFVGLLLFGLLSLKAMQRRVLSS